MPDRNPLYFGMGLWFVLSVWPSGVRAGNTDEVLLGNEAALLGGAVTAVVSQGSALWYNPAGLTHIDQNSVDLSLSAYTLRLYRIPRALTTTTTAGVSANGNTTEVVIVPAAASYVRTTKSGLRLAFGVFTTSFANYNERPTLSFPDVSMPQLEWEWLLEVSNEIAVYQLIGGIAWAVNDKLFLGATVNGSVVTNTQSGQIGGALLQDPQENDAILAATATSRNALTGFGIRLGFGLMWKPSSEVSVGAAFQTASYLFFKNTSVQSIQSTGTVLPDGSFNSLTLGTEDDTESSFEFDQFEPWRLRAGFAYDFGRTLLSLDADVQVNQGPTKVAGNGRVGVLVMVADGVSVGAGLFTDRSPNPGPTTFGEFNLDFYGLTSGVEFDKFRRFAAGVGSRGITFRTAVALRYAFGTGDFAGAAVADNVNDLDIQDLDPILPTLTNITIHELSIYVGSGIRF